MTSKHIAAIAIAALLGVTAVVMVLLCGRSTICSAPGVFPSIVTLAGAILSLASGIIGGVFGHAKSQDETRRAAPTVAP